MQTAAAIALDKTTLSPTVTVGQDAADDTFQVWDTGDVALDYTVTDDVAWLSVAPTSGTSSGAGDKQSHTVSYDTSGLSAGTYTGHISVADPSASNTPQSITVSLTVQTAAAIALDKTTLSPTVTVGQDAADDTFQVWDTGDVALDYTVADDVAWLSVAPTSGSSTGSGDKQSHTVSYDTSALSAGTYTGHISVADAAASNSPQTITVSLTVQTAAAIALDKTTLSPTVTVGQDAADDSFQVWDTGDVALDYTVTDDAAWLSVAPASGTSTGSERQAIPYGQLRYQRPDGRHLHRSHQRDRRVREQQPAGYHREPHRTDCPGHRPGQGRPEPHSRCGPGCSG